LALASSTTDTSGRTNVDAATIAKYTARP